MAAGASFSRREGPAPRMVIPKPPRDKSRRGRQAGGDAGASVRTSSAASGLVRTQEGRSGSEWREGGQGDRSQRSRERSPSGDVEAPASQRRHVDGASSISGGDMLTAIPISLIAPEPSSAGVGSGVLESGSGSATVDPTSVGVEAAVPPSPSYASVMKAVERVIKPVFKDLEGFRDESKKLRKSLELKRNLAEMRKEEIKAAEAARDKALAERDQVVISQSVVQRELEETRERLTREVTNGRGLEEEVLKANSDRIQVEGELDHLKGQYSALNRDYAELKVSAEKVEALAAEWSGKYKELQALMATNYHGAWNNAILQIRRDNPWVELDLTKINRYDDWVAYTEVDPLEGYDEDDDKHRQVPWTKRL